MAKKKVKRALSRKPAKMKKMPAKKVAPAKMSKFGRTPSGKSKESKVQKLIALAKGMLSRRLTIYY
jgi:hypothetical protein